MNKYRIEFNCSYFENNVIMEIEAGSEDEAMECCSEIVTQVDAGDISIEKCEAVMQARANLDKEN
jgi:hypothetical protein